jgi:hypothetical protein
MAAARRSAWLNPRRRSLDGWSGTGTSVAPASKSPGAVATIWAAIASATPAAPRNFSACTSVRAGPS